MLFQARFRDPIRRGEIKCTVRIWQRAHVRAGGRYRLGSGAIVVDRIDEIGLEGLTPELARRCGFASLVELLKVAKHGPGERVFQIEFHYVDAPARPPIDTSVDRDVLNEVRRKLDAMDARASRPWTREMLRLIAANPGVRAADLAASVGRERLDFKADVRKLKTLGLTISLEVGYRLSPRGKALLKSRA
jgi:hypothetical protein